MKEKQIKVNGTDIYVMTNEHLQTFCLSLYIKAGSMYEDKKVNGITHLFEHAMFRSVKSQYPQDFYDLLVENGITFNACTYKELVHFEISGFPEGFDLAVEIISKMFEDFAFSAEELNLEKKRIKAEILEENERGTLDYFSNCNIWHGTKLENTIAGYCKTLDRISRKALNEYKQEIMKSGNFFLCLTGNASENDVEKLKRCISSLNIPKATVINDNIAPVPEDFCKRRLDVAVKRGDWCLVKIAFDVDFKICPIKIMDFFYYTLFRGDNAMFYTELSEETPLIYSYDYTTEQYQNIGSLKVDFEVSKKNLTMAIQKAVEVFNDLKTGKFNFDGTVKKITSTYRSMIDNSAEINWTLAYENHILGAEPIDYTKANFGKYDGITKQQVADCAAKVFTCNNLVFCIKSNKKQINTEELKNILKDLG